jgi:hypothetical protein
VKGTRTGTEALTVPPRPVALHVTFAVAEESMMNWDNLYLMKLSPDWIINETASTYRRYYNVPKAQRFVPPGESTKRDRDWTRLRPNSLDGLTMEDKLMIVAHGSETMCDKWYPRDLADELRGWGLTEIGLITFKVCYIGRGTFLETFVKWAGSHSKIQVGWVKGYRGPCSLAILGGLTKPTEVVYNHNNSGQKSGGARYKIVAGMHAQSVPNSRYVLQDDV